MLTPEDKIFLLRAARRTLRSVISGHGKPSFENVPAGVCGIGKCFVTLRNLDDLRGCIGSVHAFQPLHLCVIDMTEQSATADSRFNVITEAELDTMNIEVSVLSELTRIKHTNEIRLGDHGLYVRKGRYSGLLLPQVATEWKFGLEEFISHTCSKAGLSPDAWRGDKDLEISVFTTEKFSAAPEKKVLFACTHNMFRSQMAEAFATHDWWGVITAYSGGSEPAAEISPLAVQVMHEVGIDISGAKSKQIPNERFDYLVTMGCDVQCPTMNATHRIDLELPDPSKLSIEEIRKIRDTIEQVVDSLGRNVQGQILKL